MESETIDLEAGARPSTFGLLVRSLVQPKRSVRAVLGRTGSRRILLLVVLSLISWTLGDLQIGDLDELGEMMAPQWIAMIAAAAVVLSIGIGIGLFYLFAWLVKLVGRYLDGEADGGEIRTALAWGAGPAILALAYRLPIVIYALNDPSAFGSGPELRVGDEGVRFQTGLLSGESLLLAFAVGLLDFAMFVWQVVLTSYTLGEVQHFSALKGFANLAVAASVPVVAVIVLVIAGLMTGITVG